MTTARSGQAEEPKDPWGPFGLVMASVWLVFLGFPLVAALQDPDIITKVSGVVIVIAFAVVFVQGCRIGMRGELGSAARQATPYYVAAVGLAIAMVAIVGPNAIGVGIFLIGLPLYTYHLPQALLLSTCAILGMGLALVVTDSFAEVGFLLFIALGVMIMNIAIRVAITRGETYERTMRELHLATERERVARDVHDVLGHSLTVIAAKSELAERLLDVDIERARAELADIHSLTREAISEVRSTVGGLRTTQLSEEIAAARVALTAAGVHVAAVGQASDVDPRNRVLFAWVLREATTNIVRHSGATQVSITLAAHDLTVSDNGRGIAQARPGNGIRGMRERVSAAGGEVTLADAPDGGTRLTVEMAA